MPKYTVVYPSGKSATVDNWELALIEAFKYAQEYNGCIISVLSTQSLDTLNKTGRCKLYHLPNVGCIEVLVSQ